MGRGWGWVCAVLYVVEGAQGVFGRACELLGAQCTTYSARVPTCRLRTTADAVYVTVRLRYRTQCEVGRVAKEGLRISARNGRAFFAT